MKKRPFRLEQLLALRQRHEDEKTQQLAEAERRHREGQAHLARLRDDEARLVRRLTGERRGRIDATDLQNAESYLARVAHEIGRQDEMVGALAAEVTRSRDELVAALKAKKTLDRLQRKHRERQEHEEKLAEGRATDELVMNRVVRRDL